MRHEEREQEEREVLAKPSRREPGALLIERTRLRVPAVEPAPDGAEEVFEIDGLRAGPATPGTAPERRHEEDANHHAAQRKHEQQRVGGQERVAHQRELAARQVHEEDRLAEDPQMRCGEEGRHEEVGHHLPSAPPLPV